MDALSEHLAARPLHFPLAGIAGADGLPHGLPTHERPRAIHRKAEPWGR